MIWLIGLILAGMIGGGFYWKSKAEYGEDFGAMLLIVFGCLFLAIFLILVPCWTMQNSAGLAQWQAFYNINTKNYQIAVDETASYLSGDKFVSGTLIEGSIEKTQLATAVSERIKEWRDAVNEYNTTIASMQYFDRNIWTGIMIPNKVQELKLLVIE